MKSFFALAVLTVALTAHAAKPNIVYILADDMGTGDVMAYNKDSKFPTPNIDRIASEGMRFTDAHTSSSVCTPTRYGIITGRYAWRTKLKSGVTHAYSTHLIDPARQTVASLLKNQGYQTACIGKWHLGMDWANTLGDDPTKTDAKNIDFTVPIKNGPLDVGFDYYFGISASLNMDPHAFIEDRQLQGTLEYLKDGEAVKVRGLIRAKPGWSSKEFQQDQVLPTFAKKACDWIRANADKPFFVYMPLNSPHSPIVPSQAFAGKSGLSSHGDFCMETDWAVGEVLSTLDELGIAENTLVIFTTDNGTSPAAKLDQMQAKGHYSSWIYRGLKGTTWEGGHRVPFVVRWPKTIQPSSISTQPICTTDLLATCAEILDVNLSDDTAEDSVSFLPALNAAPISGGEKRGIVHHSDDGIFAIRRGKWKLMLDNKGGSRRKNPKDKPVINPAALLLFDMQNDPIASTNLSAQYPEVVIELKRLLADYINQGRSTLGTPQSNDPIYKDRDWPQTDVIKEYLD